MKFTEDELWFLYCFAQEPFDLEAIFNHYILFNRCAVPEYKFVSDCLAKAVTGGMVTVTEDDEFAVTGMWYEQLHHFDDDLDPEFHESALKMSEQLSRLDVKELNDEEYVLPLKLYDQVFQKVDQYWKKLFDDVMNRQNSD